MTAAALTQTFEDPETLRRSGAVDAGDDARFARWVALRALWWAAKDADRLARGVFFIDGTSAVTIRRQLERWIFEPRKGRLSLALCCAVLDLDVAWMQRRLLARLRGRVARMPQVVVTGKRA